jgi:PRC-barrel domain protein
MKTFDLLHGDAARAFDGYELKDKNGDSVGTIHGFWLDPSTSQVAFVGVKSRGFGGKVHALPAADVAIDERGNLVDPRHTADFIRNSPIFDPEVEFSEVAKEGLDAYYGRDMPDQRVTSIEQVRPEEALAKRNFTEELSSRSEVEGEEKAFFKHTGFVTDPLPEVDASNALEQAQEEAESRNRADRGKRGDLD